MQVDPDDPGVHYWLGTLSTERADERDDLAEAHLRRAVELAPNDPSSIYGLYSVLGRAGKGETAEAKALIERFHGFEEAAKFGSPALTKHLKRGNAEYGEAGRYALAIRDLARPTGAVFSDASAGSGLAVSGETTAAPGIACGDVDGDGDDDLFVAGPAGGVLYRDDHGAFTDATRGSGLEGLPGPNRAGRGTVALFFDVDDDGVLDLAVAGERLRLFRGLAGGRFEEIPAEKLGPAAAKPYVALAAADLDHDGDLDLLAAGPASAWLRNNRDGTFLDATAERGVEANDTRAVVAFDADGDTVSDLLWFGPPGPPRLRKNGRLAPFEPDARLDAYGPATSGTVGDADGDGFLDVVLVREDGGVALVRGNGAGAYGLDPTFPSRAFGATSAAIADFDGDGRPDVLLVGRRVTLLRGLERGGWRPEAVSLPDVPRGPLAIADFDGDGDLDVVLTAKGAAPTLLRNVSRGTRHAVRLRVRGVADRVEGRTWSNAHGVGADVEVKAGDLVARRVVLAGSGFPGQMTDELVFGLGDRPRADFVRVQWTDGVRQNEYDVPVDRPHVIREVNRKIASCPVLFAWTGARFEYVTDTLGVGGLGFYLGPKLGYGPPDPTEVLRLPALAPKDGRYVVQLLENLEEVSYLDEARLIAVDHPSDLVVHADERFASDVPLPADRFYAAKTPIVPVTATDDAGRDVLGKLLADDRDTVDGLVRDERFVGFAKDHSLVLDFGDRLAGLRKDERPILFLTGWVEYGYSKTSVAASQAGIDIEAPALEVPDGQGGWKKAASIGYPAGNTRTMTYDVTGILGPNCSRCRIRTNLEVYWDRIYLAPDAAARPARDDVGAPRRGAPPRPRLSARALARRARARALRLRRPRGVGPVPHDDGRVHQDGRRDAARGGGRRPLRDLRQGRGGDALVRDRRVPAGARRHDAHVLPPARRLLQGQGPLHGARRHGGAAPLPRDVELPVSGGRALPRRRRPPRLPRDLEHAPRALTSSPAQPAEGRGRAPGLRRSPQVPDRRRAPPLDRARPRRGCRRRPHGSCSRHEVEDRDRHARRANCPARDRVLPRTRIPGAPRRRGRPRHVPDGGDLARAVPERRARGRRGRTGRGKRLPRGHARPRRRIDDTHGRDARGGSPGRRDDHEGGLRCGMGWLLGVHRRPRRPPPGSRVEPVHRPRLTPAHRRPRTRGPHGDEPAPVLAAR